MKIRRSAAIPLIVAPSLALILAGCGGQPRQGYQGVCVDTRTNTRISDGQCPPNGGSGYAGNPYLWYWYGMNSRYPAVGQPLTSGFTRSVPSDSNYVRGGAPTTAGQVTGKSLSSSSKGVAPGASKVSRGGFGSSSKGGSVGG